MNKYLQNYVLNIKTTKKVNSLYILQEFFLRFNFSLFISISELEKMVAIIVVAFMILKILLSLFADIIKYLKRAQSNINFMLNGLLEPGVFFLQIYFSFFKKKMLLVSLNCHF